MAPRANKYRAKATPCGRGHNHASRRESARCDELHILLRAGAISDLTIEPKFYLAPGGVPIIMGNGHRAQYRPDFLYRERGRQVAEDIKGMIVRDFPLRAALFRLCFPEIELRVLK